MRDHYLKPFRGIIYNKAKVGGIAPCVCPPYDVISDDETYLSRSPYNAVRLELPRPLPGMDRYAHARQTFINWCEEGALVPDRERTIYIYEQEFDIEGKTFFRRGFIGLQKLDKERILTHEQTRKKAKEDREKLIVALGAYTSFPFGLYEDSGLEVENLLETAEKDGLFDFIDDEAIRNRFYRMTKPSEMDALAELMDARKIYIADGHHRLDVSFRLNLSHIPFYLTNMYSKGVVILPYHRIVTLEQKRDLRDLLGLLQNHVQIEKIPFEGSQSISQAIRRITLSREPSFVLYPRQDQGSLYVLTAPTPTEGAGPLERLKVNILHSDLLRNVLAIKEEEISFTQDPGELLESVRTKAADLAFLLPPTTTTEVKEVADCGLDMPPKSTFFYPKILTGLVYHKYA
ncbi:MAG TPA: DUF1015 domain-containing protein [Syntrophorhabdaceae bacterium]|jgi:uncharacterized protein (DUF1015 family)